MAVFPQRAAHRAEAAKPRDQEQHQREGAGSQHRPSHRAGRLLHLQPQTLPVDRAVGRDETARLAEAVDVPGARSRRARLQPQRPGHFLGHRRLLADPLRHRLGSALLLSGDLRGGGTPDPEQRDGHAGDPRQEQRQASFADDQGQQRKGGERRDHRQQEPRPAWRARGGLQSGLDLHQPDRNAVLLDRPGEGEPPSAQRRRLDLGLARLLFLPVRLRRRRDPLVAIVERLLLALEPPRRRALARVARRRRGLEPHSLGEEDAHLRHRRGPGLPGCHHLADRVAISSGTLHERGHRLQRHDRLALLRLVRDLPARPGHKSAQQRRPEQGGERHANQKTQPV